MVTHRIPRPLVLHGRTGWHHRWHAAATHHGNPKGLSAVEKIVTQEKLDGYHGPVIENIELKDPKFRTAVEVGPPPPQNNERLAPRGLRRECLTPLPFPHHIFCA